MVDDWYLEFKFLKLLNELRVPDLSAPLSSNHHTRLLCLFMGLPAEVLTGNGRKSRGNKSLRVNVSMKIHQESGGKWWRKDGLRVTVNVKICQASFISNIMSSYPKSGYRIIFKPTYTHLIEKKLSAERWIHWSTTQVYLRGIIEMCFWNCCLFFLL